MKRLFEFSLVALILLVVAVAFRWDRGHQDVLWFAGSLLCTLDYARDRWTGVEWLDVYWIDRQTFKETFAARVPLNVFSVGKNEFPDPTELYLVVVNGKNKAEADAKLRARKALTVAWWVAMAACVVGLVVGFRYDSKKTDMILEQALKEITIGERRGGE